MTNKSLPLTLISCLFGLALTFGVSGCDSKDGDDKAKAEAEGGEAKVEAKADEGEAEVEAKATDAKAEAEVDTTKSDGPVNLCTKYKSCDGCIAGQQTEGKTEGEAETQCALAVTGCWATWDKPVTCGEKSYDKKPE